MPPEELAETMQEIGALKALFADALERISKGDIVPLTGVDQRISTLCRTVQTADPSHQQIYLPELATLIDLLNGYEAALRKAHDAAGAANQA
jgi:hypothetical protein